MMEQRERSLEEERRRRAEEEEVSSCDADACIRPSLVIQFS